MGGELIKDKEICVPCCQISTGNFDFFVCLFIIFNSFPFFPPSSDVFDNFKLWDGTVHVLCYGFMVFIYYYMWKQSN